MGAYSTNSNDNAVKQALTGLVCTGIPIVIYNEGAVCPTLGVHFIPN